MIRGTGRYFDWAEPGERLSKTRVLGGVHHGKFPDNRATLGEILEIPGVLDYEIGQWGHLSLHWEDTLDVKDIDVRWFMFELYSIDRVKQFVRDYNARNG